MQNNTNVGCKYWNHKDWRMLPLLLLGMYLVTKVSLKKRGLQNSIYQWCRKALNKLRLLLSGDPHVCHVKRRGYSFRINFTFVLARFWRMSHNRICLQYKARLFSAESGDKSSLGWEWHILSDDELEPYMQPVFLYTVQIQVAQKQLDYISSMNCQIPYHHTRKWSPINMFQKIPNTSNLQRGWHRCQKQKTHITNKIKDRDIGLG